jgi:outer membrane cobalamin receptor
MKQTLVSLACTIVCGGALAQATAPVSPSSSNSIAPSATSLIAATPQTTATPSLSAKPQTTAAQNGTSSSQITATPHVGVQTSAAQNNTPQVPSQTLPPPAPSYRESIVVLGQPEPVTLGEAARSGMVLDTQTNPLAVSQLTDYLRTDSSVDLEQRGGGGVQTDVSIRGASFEQTLVLLNGLRINDVETSHFNLDVPIPLEAIGGIDVLHGAGSTLYGSDAIGGVVNVRTLRPEASTLRLRTAAGSYGINEQSVVASGVSRRATEVLGGSRDFSSGFIADRDYRSEQASSETVLQSPLGATDLLFAGSDRGFGADQFYGNYPSFERTKGWYAMLQQQLGSNTDAAVSYRRHTDRFVLVRANPGLYTNQHIDESWQALLRRRDNLGSRLHLDTGLEEDLDAIQSNNLGHHGRNRGAGYAQLSLRSNAHGTLSVGAREEVFSGGDSVFSPSFAGSVRAGHGVKLRGAIGYGFRLPTYTDLYYSDPTTLGNPNLRPESAWSYEAGADWFVGSRLVLSATGFSSPQSNTIDYVRPNANSLWHATNLTAFRYSGFEFASDWRPTSAQRIRASWTYVAGAQNVLNGLQSEYVFNYPVNNASVEWLASWREGLTMRTRLGVTQRFQRDAYPLLDVSLMRSAGRIQPFVQITNLTNTGYEEIQSVRMQGRAFTGGLAISLTRGR